MTAQIQYDNAGNAIDVADLEISRLHTVLGQLDAVEQDFDRVRSIRDIVSEYRVMVESLERNLDASSPSHNQGYRNAQQQWKKSFQQLFQKGRTSTQEQMLIPMTSMPESITETCLIDRDLTFDQSESSSSGARRCQSTFIL